VRMTRSLLLAVLAAPLVAWGSSGTQPVVIGASYTVNNSPGAQTDPHVSGELVAYTNETATSSEIRYHDLGTGQDQGIFNGGALDFLSDIHGSRIVFSRSSGTQRNIHLFDVTSGTQVELAPGAGVVRNHAAIGGNTVAWVDNGLTGTSSASVIVAYDLATASSTSLTGTTHRNSSPSVSPDGQTVAWAQCDSGGNNCDIHLAQRTGATWAGSAITGSQGSEASPSTDGQIVAYVSLRNNGGLVESDIVYQAVGGGAETIIALPGSQQQPSVAGRLIAFESLADTATGNFDILLFDTRTGLLYQLTESPDDERLSDIDVDPATGVVRVVFVRRENNDFNVYAFSFVVQEPAAGCENEPVPADDGCADPSGRPLLAELILDRDTGGPSTKKATFTATADEPGLVCVANGASGGRATSGKVKLNGTTVVNADGFKKAVSQIERAVILKAQNELTASIAGRPGSSYTVRVYGNLTGCAGQAASTAASLQVREVGGKDLKTIAGKKLGPAHAPAAAQDEALAGIVGGCSSTGSGAPLFALVGLVLLALLRSTRRAAQVRVPRTSR
jgi:uncharacterized protein (TIGR03382 family)